MGFLQNVVARKRGEVARKREAFPLDALARRSEGRTIRDFRRALSGGRRIIAEVKKRSPAAPSFRQARSTDLLAPLYERHGASAVSVVTDEANFGTSILDAERIRSEVALPVLVKDFIVDPYQVHEARAFGADAVLLISRILDGDALGSLLALVRRLGMQAVVEVHTEGDLGKAREAGADIVGINNRDLETLAVSLDTTRRLIAHVGDGALVVSESGIRTRDDIDELSRLGVDAFLVGSALLESPDPGRLLESLLGKDGRSR